MIKKLKLKLVEKYGMTLVETVIGFGLLAIASTMLLTGFLTATSLIKEANDFKVSSARVATAVDVEEKSLLQSEPKSGSVSVNGIRVNGMYYNYIDKKTNLKYKVFVPSTFDKSEETDQVKK